MALEGTDWPCHLPAIAVPPAPSHPLLAAMLGLVRPWASVPCLFQVAGRHPLSQDSSRGGGHPEPPLLGWWPGSPRGPMLMLISLPRVGLLVALPRAASCAVGQRDTPLVPEDVWSRNVYCHSHTLSTWGLRELTLGLPRNLEAGWLPSIPGLVMLRRAPRIPPPPSRTIALAQCSGRGGLLSAGFPSVLVT